MKDFVKNQQNEYLTGKIFRLIVNHPEGLTAAQIAVELGVNPPYALEDVLAEMEIGGLIKFDDSKMLWIAA